MSKPRETVADRLDRLYMKSIRCPYCHTKIPKGTAKCENCGITKEQIYNANLVLNKKQAKHKVIYSKTRPASIPFWKMGLGGMFGFLGIHCFVAKRRWRGWFILLCTLIYIASYIAFPPENVDLGWKVHWFRDLFEANGWPFPFDMFALAAIALWIWDWSTILLGQFKYPVVLREEEA